MTLTPAYGRDYKSGKAALADFNANRDFIINDIMDKDDGRYVNKEQLIGIKAQVFIRFKQLRNVIVVKLPKS